MQRCTAYSKPSRCYQVLYSFQRLLVLWLVLPPRSCGIKYLLRGLRLPVAKDATPDSWPKVPVAAVGPYTAGAVPWRRHRERSEPGAQI